MDLPSDLELCAIHEAGHAVVGDFFGLGPLEADVVPAEGRAGVVSFDGDLEGVVGATVLVAGRAAERILLSRAIGALPPSETPAPGNFDPHDLPAPPEAQEPAEGSLATDDAQLRELVDPNGAHFAYETARGLLEDRWQTVRAIADALVERRSLDRAQLRELLDAEPPGAAPVTWEDSVTEAGWLYGEPEAVEKLPPAPSSIGLRPGPLGARIYA